MDVRWVNPFIEGTGAVLEALGIGDLRWGQLSLEDGALTNREVTVLLGVGGALAGAVMVAMDGGTVSAIADVMIGDGVPRSTVDELLISAISELGNMLVGRASVLLERQDLICTITPPAVIVGERVAIAMRPFRRLVLPLQTAVGNVTLALALHAGAVAKEAAEPIEMQGGIKLHG